MKKLLLLTLTLLVSTFSYSQDYLTTLRFDKSTKFDELIHQFDTPSKEVGYFEFSIQNDKPTELHFHGENNTTCKTFKITEFKFGVTQGDLVYDKYICKDTNTNEDVTLFIYMNNTFTKFNIMLSSKDNRGTIYTCNRLEINDYKGPTLFKNLESWYINQSIYELKSMN